jgi:hypothetical protein
VAGPSLLLLLLLAPDAMMVTGGVTLSRALLNDAPLAGPSSRCCCSFNDNWPKGHAAGSSIRSTARRSHR